MYNVRIIKGFYCLESCLEAILEMSRAYRAEGGGEGGEAGQKEEREEVLEGGRSLIVTDSRSGADPGASRESVGTTFR